MLQKTFVYNYGISALINTFILFALWISIVQTTKTDRLLILPPKYGSTRKFALRLFTPLLPHHLRCSVLIPDRVMQSSWCLHLKHNYYDRAPVSRTTITLWTPFMLIEWRLRVFRVCLALKSSSSSTSTSKRAICKFSNRMMIKRDW